MNDELLLPVPLHIFAVAVMLAFLAWVAHLIRSNRLNLRDSLSWLLSTAFALLLTLFPGILRGFASALHIQVPANALCAVAFVYVLLNLLALTVTISTQATRVRRLTQECALLRAHVEELRRSLDAERGGG